LGTDISCAMLLMSGRTFSKNRTRESPVGRPPEQRATVFGADEVIE
jgi:hypothetical protein